jgi:hypothetical protein
LEARLAAAAPSTDASARVREAASDLVDYLLFVDEAPLVGPMQGSSGFAEWFAKQGRAIARGARCANSTAAAARSEYPAAT